MHQTACNISLRIRIANVATAIFPRSSRGISRKQPKRSGVLEFSLPAARLSALDVGDVVLERNTLRGEAVELRVRHFADLHLQPGNSIAFFRMSMCV